MSAPSKKKKTYLTKVILVVVRVKFVISCPPLDLLKIATLMPSAEIRIDSQRPSFILENEIWRHISGALQVDSQTVDAVIHMLEESDFVSINCRSD